MLHAQQQQQPAPPPEATTGWLRFCLTLVQTDKRTETAV